MDRVDDPVGVLTYRLWIPIKPRYTVTSWPSLLLDALVAVVSLIATWILFSRTQRRCQHWWQVSLVVSLRLRDAGSRGLHGVEVRIVVGLVSSRAWDWLLRNLPLSCSPIAAVAVWYNAGMDEKQNTAEPVKKAHGRWFRLSPDRFVVSLLLVICFLWLSERFQWFGFNHHKGWTVLIAVAAVGVTAFAMLLWWTAGLIFRWRFQFGIRSLLAVLFGLLDCRSWMAVEMKAGSTASGGGRVDQFGRVGVL